MRYETMRLEVPGQQTGEALLQLYLLDSLEFAPERLRPMILVLPGGGYTRRSDREKEPIVMKFLSMGFHACVLEYSVAPNRFPVAVRELALAIAAIREHADEWHVKADAVIPCGFSAGGHLACSIGTFWNRPEVYEAVGKAPGISASGRTDFKLSGYYLRRIPPRRLYCQPVGKRCFTGGAGSGFSGKAGDREYASGIFLAYCDRQNGSCGKQSFAGLCPSQERGEF